MPHSVVLLIVAVAFFTWFIWTAVKNPVEDYEGDE